MLVDNGADPFLPDHEGRNAFDLCSPENRTALANTVNIPTDNPPMRSHTLDDYVRASQGDGDAPALSPVPGEGGAGAELRGLLSEMDMTRFVECECTRGGDGTRIRPLAEVCPCRALASLAFLGVVLWRCSRAGVGSCVHFLFFLLFFVIGLACKALII